MIVLIDGPEKTGKSTHVKKLAKALGAQVRHWGPVDPDDRVYLVPLMEDLGSDQWVIWDRAWPSEHVYGNILKRNRRLADDPFLGEWLYGRALLTRGVRVILLPDDISMSKALRDQMDLQVNPVTEYGLYHSYALTYGYTLLKSNYTDQRTDENVGRIVQLARTQESNPWHKVMAVPEYAGPLSAGVIFMGEKRSDQSISRFPGSFLPFTSRLTSIVGRRIGSKAIHFGWTNIGDIPVEFLWDKLVVACGDKAARYLEDLEVSPRVVIPHPAWLYKYNTESAIEKRKLTDNFLCLIGEW